MVRGSGRTILLMVIVLMASALISPGSALVGETPPAPDPSWFAWDAHGPQMAMVDAIEGARGATPLARAIAVTAAVDAAGPLGLGKAFEAGPASADTRTALERLSQAGLMPSMDAAVTPSDVYDDLAPALDQALAAVVDGYRAYAAAHRDAYAGVETTAFEAQAAIYASGNTPEAPLGNPQRLADFLATRAMFLDAVERLDDVVDEDVLRTGAGASCRIEVPDAVSISTCDGDDVYTDDYLLQVDLGGNDVYLNNAGGSAELGARALVDIGGDDAYGNTSQAPSERRGDGLNGGAAFFSTGLLVDTEGNDVYAGGSNGVNGGADLEGHSLLIDLEGNDVYDTEGDGGNGGAACCYDSARLLDMSGTDLYLSPNGTSVNGGARSGSESSWSHGLLYDDAGDDRYEGGTQGANGGGFLRGMGNLYDAGGDDVYIAVDSGVNGGARSGYGLLYDVEGDDVYRAEGFGANGGGWAIGGSGLLIDGAGADTYVAVHGGINGGAGLLGVGRLIDRGGDDRYEANGFGANAGLYHGGTALLYDQGGDDVYIAAEPGSNGEAQQGVAALIDMGGRDYYEDPGGNCTDCSQVGKGVVGVQWDQAG